MRLCRTSLWSAVRPACMLMLFLFACGAVLFSQSTTVTNVFQNHYAYGYDFGTVSCPKGYNIPSGQYPSTYHLERGHAIHHVDPINSANDYWVYWAHFDNSSYGTAEIAIFKSTTECGPYILQTNLYPNFNVDGAGYGFRPGGWQSRDDNIFRDSDQTYNADGTVASYASAYLITASNDLGTQTTAKGATCNYANDSMAIFKMTPDYLGIDPSTNTSTNGANWVFVCDQREAPVMFRKGSKYFLITSQAAGWYPSQGGYGVSSNPLTQWTPDPLPLGNTSTFGLQTADGFTIAGTQANTYVLSFDHLGGSDSKNPASAEKFDTGNVLLPVILDDTAGTATLNWYSSWTVDNSTGALTLPALTDLALNSAASSTVNSLAASGSNTFVPANAFDGNYFTRWTDALSGSSAFNAATSTTSTLCPVTNATSTTKCSPSLISDIGSIQPIQEIDLSWYMVKGSEPYYTFKIAYSNDKVTWNTLDYTTFASASNAASNNISSVPFSNNITYGFNALPVNFSARYVALTETSVVQQNSTSPFYPPNAFEMAVIASTAPASPQVATVTVTPSATTTSPGSSLTVGVTVAGPAGQPVPTGYIQLSAPGYISETFGLVNGANSFTIPAGTLAGGANTITVNFRSDPTSTPIYGLTTRTGSATVTVTPPDAPTNLVVTATSPNALTSSWTASLGASSYMIYRSLDGGATFSQLASTASTSYVNTGLVNGSTYCYEVAATNTAGTGAPSAPVCAAATGNFPVTSVAVTPAGPGGLNVSYAAVANATSYVIKRSSGGDPYTTLTTTTATTYLDSGLAVDGSNYCYTVAAVFSTGTAADSSPVCNTATANFVPTDLQVTPWADGQLYLSWVVNGNASSYTIKRSINGGAFTALPSQATLWYTDTNLTDYSNVYCYTVSETLNGVSSPESNAVCNSPTGKFLSVADFSFESPAVSLWSTTPSAVNGYGWTFVGNGSNAGNNSGVSAVSGTFTNGNTPPIYLGKQVGVLEGTGSVTQTLSGLTVGQRYTVIVSASERQTSLQSGGANAFNVVLNGTSIGTLSAPQAIPYYRDYTASFTASGATSTIALVGTSTSGSSAVLIDNVRIVSSGSAAYSMNLQPATATYGNPTAALTASATLDGTHTPAGSMVFRVNGGTETPGSCTSSSTTETCTVNYPIVDLPVGTYGVAVTYAGDANYTASSASGSLSVIQATPAVTAGGNTCVYSGTACAGSGSATGVNGASLGSVTLSYSGTGSSVYGPSTVAPTLVGTYQVTASFAGNTNYSAGRAIAAISITAAATTLSDFAVTPATQQYSDTISISATSVSAPGIPGSVSFYLNYGTATQQQMGATQPVGAEGTAMVSNIPLLETTAGAMLPGSHNVTAVFTPTDTWDYAVGTATLQLPIMPEDANFTYTGEYVFYTASANTYSVAVPLTFTVQDSNAVPPGMSVYDRTPGDIRKGRFNILVNGAAVPACSHLQPSLVSADTRVGTIGCNYTVSFPSSQSGVSPTIQVVADTSSYYAPSAGDTQFAVSVNLPNLTNSINGGGFIVNTASAGTYAADPGLKSNFGFNVKFNKGGTNLQGSANIIVQSKGRTYQIKSNAITSLGVTDTSTGGYGAFIAKANITDITDLNNPVVIEGNDVLTINFHDNGTPGSTDSISISLYNGGILRFSSNWTGTSTVEQSLGGGNLTAR